MRWKATSPGAAATRDRSPEPRIDRVEAAAYVVPTDGPESDGTFAWTETTLVVAEVAAGGAIGLGYTYADRAAALVVTTTLAPAVRDIAAVDTTAAWVGMQRAVRNAGRPGIALAAISAVDAALWDLKGRLLGLSVSTLLGRVRERVAVYGSGGFTSYSVPRLQQQLSAWAASGIGAVKMKVGRAPADDPARVAAARAAIGDSVELFVDANGAWTPSRALAMAARFERSGVSWLEEPVSSDDLDGLAAVRARAPAGMEVAAGEYGYTALDFRRMLERRAVDVLQADATRCGGITGFLGAAALADAFGVPLSAHTAPSLHAAPCCAVPRVRHVEYFHDHVRIEAMLFDGAARADGGSIRPDASRPGLGLELKRVDAARFRVL
jgi:L-alanine-DL-glutamate epimerase-like enolase superfamily enzyme